MEEDLPTTVLILFTPQTEAYAAAVRRFLEEQGLEVYFPDEQMYDVSDQRLETLLNHASYYDFCISLLSPASTGPEAADADNANIFFEFGLFLGRLGPYRAFPIVEANMALFADWEGVTVASYEVVADDAADAAAYDAAVASACASIYGEIQSGRNNDAPVMLPSTALAFGYYRNFLQRVFVALNASPSVQILRFDEQGNREAEANLDLEQDQLVIEVRVPRDLRQLGPEFLAERLRGLQRVQVDTAVRRFPFFVDAEIGPDSSSVRLIDEPTTLIAALYALDGLFTPDFIGEPGGPRQSRLVDREIRNFENTLRILASDRDEERFFRFRVVSR